LVSHLYTGLSRLNQTGTPSFLAAVTCPTEFSPTFGSVVLANGGAYPSTATYTCRSGYSIWPAASVTRQCTALGSLVAWADRTPQCRTMVCPAITAPAQSTLTLSNRGSYPSTAYVTCNAGYALKPRGAFKVCTPNGGGLVWNTCMYKCSNYLPIPRRTNQWCRIDIKLGSLPLYCYVYMLVRIQPHRHCYIELSSYPRRHLLGRTGTYMQR
jgi:hypothetical protein